MTVTPGAPSWLISCLDCTASAEHLIRHDDTCRLKAEMAGAHPDRGGDNEDFITARDRYVRARQAGRCARD